MKGKIKFSRFLTLIISVTLLISLFGTAATALADEGDDEDIVYYDINGNKLSDPYNAELCYSENGTPIPCPVYTADEDNEPKGEKSIPPGQLVRNGLSGPVVAVNVTSQYFLVETKFGIVQVFTDADVANMTGHRVAVKLGKIEGGASAFAHNGTDNVTGNVTGITANGTVMQFGNLYRVATALQFRLIPSKGMNKHSWGTIESMNQGCFLVDEEGNQIQAVCGNSSGNVIGLISGSGNGTGGNATPLLLQTQQMSRILARIQLRLEQAENEDNEETQARLEKQLEKLEKKQLQLEEKRAERAAVRAEKAQNKGQK